MITPLFTKVVPVLLSKYLVLHSNEGRLKPEEYGDLVSVFTLMLHGLQ